MPPGRDESGPGPRSAGRGGGAGLVDAPGGVAGPGPGAEVGRGGGAGCPTPRGWESPAGAAAWGLSPRGGGTGEPAEAETGPVSSSADAAASPGAEPPGDVDPDSGDGDASVVVTHRSSTRWMSARWRRRGVPVAAGERRCDGSGAHDRSARGAGRASCAAPRWPRRSPAPSPAHQPRDGGRPRPPPDSTAARSLPAAATRPLRGACPSAAPRPSSRPSARTTRSGSAASRRRLGPQVLTARRVHQRRGAPSSRHGSSVRSGRVSPPWPVAAAPDGTPHPGRRSGQKRGHEPAGHPARRSSDRCGPPARSGTSPRPERYRSQTPRATEAVSRRRDTGTSLRTPERSSSAPPPGSSTATARPHPRSRLPRGCARTLPSALRRAATRAMGASRRPRVVRAPRGPGVMGPGVVGAPRGPGAGL